MIVIVKAEFEWCGSLKKITFWLLEAFYNDLMPLKVEWLCTVNSYLLRSISYDEKVLKGEKEYQ